MNITTTAFWTWDFIYLLLQVHNIEELTFHIWTPCEYKFILQYIQCKVDWFVVILVFFFVLQSLYNSIKNEKLEWAV